jgi:hypothetical protein
MNVLIKTWCYQESIGRFWKLIISRVHTSLETTRLIKKLRGFLEEVKTALI